MLETKGFFEKYLFKVPLLYKSTHADL